MWLSGYHTPLVKLVRVITYRATTNSRPWLPPLQVLWGGCDWTWLSRVCHISAPQTELMIIIKCYHLGYSPKTVSSAVRSGNRRRMRCWTFRSIWDVRGHTEYSRGSWSSPGNKILSKVIGVELVAKEAKYYHTCKSTFLHRADRTSKTCADVSIIQQKVTIAVKNNHDYIEKSAIVDKRAELSTSLYERYLEYFSVADEAPMHKHSLMHNIMASHGTQINVHSQSSKKLGSIVYNADVADDYPYCLWLLWIWGTTLKTAALIFCKWFNHNQSKTSSKFYLTNE